MNSLAVLTVIVSSAFGMQSGEEAGPPVAPTETNVTGRLAVQAVQGTPDAAPIGVADVKVYLYHQNVLIDTIDGQLDEHGVAVLPGVPVGMPVLPVVQVAYANASYQKIGDIMDAAHPEQTLQVKCYETTDTRPDWSVRMWHVMIDRAADGFTVNHVVVVDNPALRTWVGDGASATEHDHDHDHDAHAERPVTTAFPMHADATNITLGRGFHDWCCTTHSERSLVNHLPLMPATTEYTFSYSIPAGERPTEIDIVAPADVDHVMVIVPAEVDVVDSNGLEYKGTSDMGSRTISTYSAASLGAGSAVTLGLAWPTPATVTTTGSLAGATKMIAGVGGGLMLLIALVVILRRPAHAVAGAAAHDGGTG